MSINTDFTVVFNPVNRTLDFSSWTNFNIKRLLRVYNLTRNVVIYQLPNSDNKLTPEIFKFVSFNSNILTLNFPTSEHSASDILIFDYVTGSGGADDVDVVSSVLPTGASTSTKQDIGNTSLSSIDDKMTTNFQDKIITGQTGQTSVINNILTTIAGVDSLDVNGYRSALIQVITTATGGSIVFEGSNDNVNFQVTPVMNQNLLVGGLIVGNITPPSNAAYILPLHFKYLRLRIVSTITGGSLQALTRLMQTTYSFAVSSNGYIASIGAITGGQTAHSSASSGSPIRIGGRVNTALDTTLTQGDASDLFVSSAGQAIQKPFGSAENDWQYAAAASGIVNTTTAVTIKSAGATSIRNHITGISIMSEALGAATELVIRDGAAGTVLFRTKIPTTGLPTTSIQFITPLRGSAATLLEVATLTASVTGAIYFNAQGYQSF